MMPPRYGSGGRSVGEREARDLAHPVDGDRKDLVVEIVAGVVQFALVDGRAVADPDIGAGALLDQEREIVAGRAGAQVASNLRADRLSRCDRAPPATTFPS